MPIPNAKVVIKALLKGSVATLAFFVILESLIRVTYFIRNSMVDYVPLPYVIGEDYGPIPPWVDGVRILEPDKELVWRARPNLHRRYVDIFSPVEREEERTAVLHQFLPTLPASLRGNPVWEISLNSEGFRDANFPKKKLSSAFRIICLGDSWTFGSNVAQEEAYPQRLRALLKEEFPEANFEVFNLGVLGYASYNGLKLLRKTIINLNPDVVVIGFAMNEPNMAGFDDEDLAAKKEPITLAKRVGGVLENTEFYKLLRYGALLLKWKPESMSQHLRHKTYTNVWFDELRDKPWLPDSLKIYEKNFLEIINLARSHDASAVILYPSFSREGPYLKVLEKISRVEGVPLVASSALIAEAQRKIEEELEEKLDLQPAKAQRAKANGETEVVFRVYTGTRPVAKGIYIVGDHPMLGNSTPNKVSMYEDGTHGDQRAGDAVWSYSATFAQGTTLYYVYTNSGEQGKWEGLDVPEIRSFKVDVKNNEEKLYKPIESFGKIYMQADGWHTNAVGYDLIAQALLEKLKETQELKEYLKRYNSNRDSSYFSIPNTESHR